MLLRLASAPVWRLWLVESRVAARRTLHYAAVPHASSPARPPSASGSPPLSSRGAPPDPPPRRWEPAPADAHSRDPAENDDTDDFGRSKNDLERRRQRDLAAVMEAAGMSGAQSHGASSGPLGRLWAWVNRTQASGHQRDQQHRQDSGDWQNQSGGGGEHRRDNRLLSSSVFLRLVGVACMGGIYVIVDRQRLYMDSVQCSTVMRGRLWEPMDAKFVTLATALLPGLAIGSLLAIWRFAFVGAVIAVGTASSGNVLLPHGQLQLINRGLPSHRGEMRSPNASDGASVSTDFRAGKSMWSKGASERALTQ